MEVIRRVKDDPLFNDRHENSPVASEVVYNPISKHWYVKLHPGDCRCFRISCGRCFLPNPCEGVAGSITSNTTTSDYTVSVGSDQWKDPSVSVMSGVVLVTEYLGVITKDNTSGKYCSCGGLGRESCLIFSGEKFTICTVCRKEKRND
jgi:hypothetical protein